MEEDDDDFYGGGGGIKQEAQVEEDRDEKMDESEDEEDSDDDVQFTLEKPEGAKQESAPTTKQQAKQTTSDSKAAKAGTPIKSEMPRSGSAAPTSVRGTLTHDGKEGKDFPELRTSKIDVNGTPTWPGANKPITEVDIDADLAELSKPWRLPGTDITDFFNYGFDEYTWVQYCLRQQSMSDTISDQKKQDQQMKAMFGGGGGGMPGMPPGMDGMPGPEQFMQMMQSGGMPPEMAAMMGMPPGMGQGQFGPGQQGGGFGSGQNSASPNPQPGQGFQPPSGPSGGQGGFQGQNMEGFSPQQIAIMQQEQQGGFQGGRGRGKRGRW